MTTVFLDTFTAADGTDPTTRDVDTHPAIAGMSRWTPGSGLPGEIQSNRLIYVDSLGVNLVLRGDALESFVIPYPYFLLASIDTTKVAGHTYGITLTLYGDGSSDAAVHYGSGGLTAYADGESSGSYFYEDPAFQDGAHILGLYVTETSVAFIVDGATVDTASISMVGSLDAKYLWLLFQPYPGDAMACDKAAVYTGITLDEAIALTAPEPSPSTAQPESAMNFISPYSQGSVVVTAGDTLTVQSMTGTALIEYSNQPINAPERFTEAARLDQASATYGPFDADRTVRITAGGGQVSYVTPSARDYGLDLNQASGLDPTKGEIRLSNEVCILTGDGVPVDYTDGTPPATGEGYAEKGSVYIRTGTGKLYVNGGTKAEPIWKLVTSAA